MGGNWSSSSRPLREVPNGLVGMALAMDEVKGALLRDSVMGPCPGEGGRVDATATDEQNNDINK